MSKLLNSESIELGTCYYPEHWDKSLWEEDLDRMLDCGIRTIRIAEFAWSKIEPEEGVFTYEFYDEFLNLAYRKGMQVIFCTPTAAPPAWLTTKYPEVLNCDKDGNVFYHGGRRHYTYNSPKYRELSAIITEKSASHYGKHPAIIGWQLDNEFNCEKSEYYAECDTQAFRKFLMEKYGDLDSLNTAWGNVFWNQVYTDWDQVYVPRNTATGCCNPHQLLDYSRFVSESVISYAKMEADIIRQYCKEGDFITTNGLFGNIDNHEMTEQALDFYTYDSYPNFAYGIEDYNDKDTLKDRKWSRNLAEVRSVAGGLFGIMEQQSGANGWNTRLEAPTPRPGQMTLWTIQSIAHGADYVSYFRWRTATFGTEMYWHGILDYSSRDNRRIREVKEIAKKVSKLKEVAGTAYKARVAIARTYDNEWDAGIDNWHRRVKEKSERSLIEALEFNHVPYDFVYLDHVDGELLLKQYEVIFYPHAVILNDKQEQMLTGYVKQGGKLVFGCRTGYKDENGQCVMSYLPGRVARICGTDIPEYQYAAPDEEEMTIKWGERHVSAPVFHDILAPLSEESEVLGIYEKSYYAGEPALIRHKVQKGETYYFGGAFGYDTAEAFLAELGVLEPYGDVIKLPKECELEVRSNAKKDYLFVLNYSHSECAVELMEEMPELTNGVVLSKGKHTLKAYECLVLIREAK